MKSKVLGSLILSSLLMLGSLPSAFAVDPQLSSFIVLVYASRGPGDVLPKSSAEDYKSAPLSSDLFRGQYPSDLRARTELPWHGDQIKQMPRLASTDSIYIRFYDASTFKLQTLGDAVRIDSIAVGNVDDPTSAQTFEPPKDQDLVLTSYALDLTSKTSSFLPNGVMKLSIGFHDGSKRDWFFILRKYGTVPGLGIADIVGVWLPVTLFGTNLNISGGGLSFATLPATVAVGHNFYFFDYSSFYIGLSIAGGLVWSGAPPTEVSSAQSFFLGKADVFALVDLGGYAYVGAGPAFDFTQSPMKVVPLIVLGVGTEVLDKIK